MFQKPCFGFAPVDDPPAAVPFRGWFCHKVSPEGAREAWSKFCSGLVCPTPDVMARHGAVAIDCSKETFQQMRHISFSSNRTKVTEGDIVEITWDCPGATNVTVGIDNGFKSSTTPVEATGCKKYRLNRSDGKTKLTLTADVDGRPIVKTLTIKVNKPKVEEAKVDDGFTKYKRLDHNNIKDKWRDIRTKFGYAWHSMGEKKQLAWRTLGLLLATMVLSMIWPKFLTFGLMVAVLYLCWVVFRR